MTDLLITAAIDLTGRNRFASLVDRIAAAHRLGLAGDVRYAAVPDGVIVARAAGGRAKAGAAVRRWAAEPAADGSYTLLAGRLLGPNPADEYAASEGARRYAAARREDEACDRGLLGDYAVIEWLPRERRLRAARSVCSRQPLHVWQHDGAVAISSIPRALFAAGAPSRVDDDFLADAMIINTLDDSISCYRGWSRVPHASVVWFGRDGAQTRRFWSIDTVPEVRFAADDDYPAAVSEQLGRAVAHDLAGARQPAVQLSGGLDSQAVAAFALAQRPAEHTLTSFTMVPAPGLDGYDRDGWFGDERAHVAALGSMYPQLDSRFLAAEDARMHDHLDALALLGSWPVHNAMIMHWPHTMMAAAAESGHDRLLGGDFGNIGFSYDGRTAFPTFLRQGKWRRLLREVSAAADERGFARRLFALAVWPHAPLGLKLLRDRGNPWTPDPFASWSALSPDFARDTRLVERAAAAGNHPHFYRPTGSRQWRRDVLAQSQFAIAEIYLALRLLHGVEQRDPLAFQPLLELCAGMPDEQFLHRGEERWLARRVLRGRVPEMVRTERRRGLAGQDWPLRVARDRARLAADVASYASDPRIARVVDFDRLGRDLAAWPGAHATDTEWRDRLFDALGSGLSYAHFVRFAEGRNAG